jgi:hypothetical protein
LHAHCVTLMRGYFAEAEKTSLEVNPWSETRS